MSTCCISYYSRCVQNRHRNTNRSTALPWRLGAAVLGLAAFGAGAAAPQLAAAADTEHRLAWSGARELQNIGSESKSIAKCDRDRVMIGRSHDGGASGPSGVRCVYVTVPGWSGRVARTGATSTSKWISESDGTAFSCPTNQVVSLRFHVNGADGDTQYRCQSLELRRSGDDRVRPVTTKNATWSSGVRESDSEYTCPTDTVMVGRQHTGNEHGTTKYQCAAPFVELGATR